MKPRLLAAAAAASMLAGCAGFADLQAPIVRQEPERFKAAQSLVEVATSPGPATDWWKTFGDSQLDDLVGEALRDSPSVAIAMARVQRSHAVAGLADAARQPSLNLEFNADRELFSANYIFPPPWGGAYWNPARMAGEFGYEFDFWGRNQARFEGARAEAEAAAADAAAARLMIAVAIARSYVELEYEFALADLVDQSIRQRAEALRLVGLRVAAGLDAPAASEKAAAQQAAVRAQQAVVGERILALRHQLAALLGAGPDRGLAIQRPALLSAGNLALPSVLPADLIGRRPDVAALRARVEAAGRYVSAAQADFYPNVNLIGFIGLQSLDITDLLKSGSKMLGLGPALHLPLFDGGRLRQQLAARFAEQDAATAQYNQSLSEALHEIADAVSRWRALEVRQAEQNKATANLRNARQYAEQRYRSGLTSRLAVTDAENDLIAEQARDADLRAQRFAAVIDLARAVGGGYRIDATNRP